MEIEKRILIEEKLFNLKFHIEAQMKHIQESRTTLETHEQLKIHTDLILEISNIFNEIETKSLEELFARCKAVEKQYLLEKKFLRY